MNILIISASMGAGHDGAARELKRRLEADGHQAEIRDYLIAFPFWIGSLIRFVYQNELRYAPFTYEATYQMWYRLPSMSRPLAWLLSMVTRRRVRRWVKASGADAVLSTYPLASLTLGRERARHRLDIPVATYVTDFCVHPLWTHPGVDLHLTVHPQSAAEATAQTGGAAAAPGPLVSDRFTDALPSRQAARHALGIGPDERVVLLVAGSWGVGAVRATFDDVVATGTWTPLVVCGRNEKLRRSLAARGTGRVLGWTDRMPELMAAADVLMENAGGLTAMEAFAAGLPVVSYRPIAGHGKGNAHDMQTAGVAALATPEDLAEVLDSMVGPVGDAQRAAGRAMFAGDAAGSVVALAAELSPAELSPAELSPAELSPAEVIPIRSGRSRLRPAAVAVGTTAASLVIGATLASTGAGIAAAHGVAVAHAPRHTTTAFVAIRVGPGALSDGGVPAALAAAHVTAIVSGHMATIEPSVIARLAAAGVDVANGGWGAHRGHNLTWANADVRRSARAIQDATGAPVRTFVPGRRLDGFELASAEWEKQQVVVSHPVQGESLPAFHAGGVYVIEASDLTAPQLLDVLSKLEGAPVPISPLSGLRDSV